MTRTERSSHPRALTKDRSENKSGLDKGLRKGGAGAHNWGSLDDEINHEADLLDEEYEGDPLPDIKKADEGAEAAKPAADATK